MADQMKDRGFWSSRLTWLGSCGGRLSYICFLAALLLVGGADLTAQTADAKIKQNQSELNRIRKERADLEKRMRTLEINSKSVAERLNNISKQHTATKRAVQTLDKQLAEIVAAVRETSQDLERAEKEAIAKRGVLNKRMVDIYKRGPLFDLEVLLSAKSLGELLTRYKYLHELAVNDRAFAQRLEALRDTIAERREQLVGLQSSLSRNKQEKVKEETRLKSLERQQQSSLKKVQADATRARNRLQELARAESRLNNLIASLEAERKKSTGAGAPKTSSSIKTSDIGNLDWPVNGSILYNFGVTYTPNGTKIIWNGIGIEAAQGTPVKAVSGGVVRRAGQLGAYGKTILLEHGGGDYSIYGSLADMHVKEGDKVVKGQAIGTVGRADPDQPPHLHFEIRRGVGAAVDPTTWLRRSRR